jgi:hypothetical protein
MLTLVLDGVSGQLHTLAALPLGKDPPSTHLIKGLAGLTVGLSGGKEKKIPAPA